MALFKLVVAGVILYAFKNYVYEMRLYLQKHRSVVWLSYEGYGSVTTQ